MSSQQLLKGESRISISDLKEGLSLKGELISVDSDLEQKRVFVVFNHNKWGVRCGFSLCLNVDDELAYELGRGVEHGSDGFYKYCCRQLGQPNDSVRKELDDFFDAMESVKAEERREWFASYKAKLSSRFYKDIFVFALRYCLDRTDSIQDYFPNYNVPFVKGNLHYA